MIRFRRDMPLKILIVPILLLCLLPLALAAQESWEPEDYLRLYLKVRTDLSGGESVYHYIGKIYSFIPGEKRMELFDYEGYSIARMEEQADSIRILSKEVGFFKDHRTGEILNEWRNPLTGEVLPVMHIFNDPVNQDLSFSPDLLPYIRQMLPSTDLGETLIFHNEIFPFHPSPLSRRDHGEYTQSDTFQAAELTEYLVNKNELLLSSSGSVPAILTFTRITPWLPFMKMGDRPGNLIFVCRGKKLAGGFDELPGQIKDYVLAQHPDYTRAPERWSEPNETAWTAFKKSINEVKDNNEE